MSTEQPSISICGICGGTHITATHTDTKEIFPTKKSRESLEQQVFEVEQLAEQRITPSRVLPEEIFSMSAQELKERFPKRYEHYVNLLRKQKLLQKGDNELGELEIENEIEDAKKWLRVLNSLDEYAEEYQKEISEDPRHPVQKEVFTTLRDFIEDGHMSGYVKLPTGAGKTILFKRFLEAVRLRSLIVVPNNVLVEQTVKQLSGSTVSKDVGTLNQHTKDYEAELIVTTYASLIQNVNNGSIKPEDFSCLILDETHRALGRKSSETINKFSEAIRIGFTATPKYTENKTTAQLLGMEICSMEVAEAIRAGMLSSARTLAVKTEVDLSTIGMRNGDYIESELMKQINNEARNQIAVDYYRSNFMDVQGVAYCAGVDHAAALAKLFTAAGIPSEVISGRLKRAERRSILKRFKNGNIKIICNADILIEGFDNEKVSVCLNLRPTMSAVIAEQRGGRVLRLDKDNPNKVGYVVDFLDDDTLAANLSRPYPILYREVLGEVSVPRALSSKQTDTKSKPSPPIERGEPLVGLKVVSTEEQFTEILRAKNEYKAKLIKRKQAKKEKEEKIRLEAERQEKEKQWKKEFAEHWTSFVEQCNVLVNSMRLITPFIKNLKLMMFHDLRAKDILQKYDRTLQKYNELVAELRNYRAGSKFIHTSSIEQGFEPTKKYFQKKIDVITQMLTEISEDIKTLEPELNTASEKQEEIEIIRQKSENFKHWKTKADIKNLAERFYISIGDIMGVANNLQKTHPEWVDKRLEPKGNIVNVYSPEFFETLIKELESR